MYKTLKSIIKDCKGYGVAEWVLLVVLSSIIAIGVLSQLLSPVQNLHNKASNNIRTFGGSGF